MRTKESKILFFIFLFYFLSMLHSMWNLSSPTRNQTHTPVLDCQRCPLEGFKTGGVLPESPTQLEIVRNSGCPSEPTRERRFHSALSQTNHTHKKIRIPGDLGTGDFSKLMSAQGVGKHGYNSTPSCYRGDCSQEGPDLLREVNTQPSQKQTLLCKLHTIPGGL